MPIRIIDPSAPKRKKRDDPEHRLSHYVDSLLTRILEEPCWFTAQDHSGRAIGDTKEQRARSQMWWNEARKKQGIKPDQLDWRVFQAPIYAEFELKYGDNKTTDGQNVTMGLLVDRGIPTGCFWQLEEVYSFLQSVGFRLHGNAANILAEEVARYQAADDKARSAIAAPASKKRASTKSFTAKPTPSAIRKMNAVRARIRF